MNPGPFDTLVTAWKADASHLKKWGADAKVLERCADELTQRIAAWLSEPLTLDQAADESGYTKSQLRRDINKGIITDIAEEGPIKIRRGDLPHKAGRLTTEETEPLSRSA